AIAEVDQGSAGIIFDHTAGATDFGKREDAGARLEIAVGGSSQIKIAGPGLAGAVGSFVKRLCPGGEHSVHIGRKRMAFRSYAGDSFRYAEGVPHLKRPKLVGIAPTHGAIDFDDSIGNLGNHGGSVDEQIAKERPEELAGAIAASHESADALGQVFD